MPSNPAAPKLNNLRSIMSNAPTRFFSFNNSICVLLFPLIIVAIFGMISQKQMGSQENASRCAEMSKEIESLKAAQILRDHEYATLELEKETLQNEVMKNRDPKQELEDTRAYTKSVNENMAELAVEMGKIGEERKEIMAEMAKLAAERDEAVGDRAEWQTAELPIMKSISRGFHPVYVFSKSKPEESEVQKESYAQVKQDLIILALWKADMAKNSKYIPLGDERNFRKPFFVDLGAGDAIENSNTYLLESNGWDGLCIEPNPQYWYRLASLRNCTVVGAFVGGNVDGAEVDVALHNGAAGGIVAEGMDNSLEDSLEEKKGWTQKLIRGGTSDKPVYEKRNVISLFTAFQEAFVPVGIDYISMDVEGAELFIMAEYPWLTHPFKFMTVEKPSVMLQNILVEKGYKMIKKLPELDETIWMTNGLSHPLTQEEIDDVIASVEAAS